MPLFEHKLAANNARSLPGTTQFSATTSGLSDRTIGVAFITPSVALMICVFVVPLLWTIVASVTSPGTSPRAAGDIIAYVSNRQWVGVEYYRDLFVDAGIWQSLVATAKFASLSVIMSTAIGFLLACQINRRFKTANFWLVVIVLPMMVASVLAASVWSPMVHAADIAAFAAPIAQLTNNFGGTSWWSGDKIAADTGVFWSMTLMQIWVLTPLVMLICLAGFRTIPDAIYQAARGDRASPRQQFWVLTFPMVLPFVVLAILFCLLKSIAVFDLAYGYGAISGTKPLGLASLYLASDMISNSQAGGHGLPGDKAAFSVLFSLLVIALAGVFVRLLIKRRLVNSPPSPKNTGTNFQLPLQIPPELDTNRSRLSSLGQGLTMAYASVAIAPLLWLIWSAFSPLVSGESLPLRELVILFTSSQDQATANGLPAFFNGIWNSATIALVSSLVCVGLGTLAGYGFSRRKQRQGGGLLGVILVAWFLSPVVIALPLLDLFGASLTANSWLLFLLYAAMNMPLAIWLMKSFFDEIPTQWEDVALSEGYSRAQVFRMITLPLVRPGMLITSLICFLLSWNDYTLIQLFSPSRPVVTPGITTADNLEVFTLAMLLLALPCLALTISLRRHLTRFVTFGMVAK